MTQKNTHKKKLPTKKTSTTTQEKIRIPKPRPNDWLTDPRSRASGESSLWIAVLTQAMTDALSNARTSEAQHHKYEAICWLTGNSHNFITVCLLAGFDPDYIRCRAKRAIVSRVQVRSEPGKGSRFKQQKAYRKRKLCHQTPTPKTPSQSPEVLFGPWTV